MAVLNIMPTGMPSADWVTGSEIAGSPVTLCNGLHPGRRRPDLLFHIDFAALGTAVGQLRPAAVGSSNPNRARTSARWRNRCGYPGPMRMETSADLIGSR